MSPHYSEALAGFRNILKYYDSLRRRVCKQHGLSQTEFDVLAFLGNNPGLDTARDIVELRMLPKSNVSVAVEALIRRGLLCRRQDTGDRRRIHLSLTPSAAPLLQDVLGVMPAFAGDELSGFSEEEARAFAGFYQRIAQNISLCLQKEGTSHE